MNKYYANRGVERNKKPLQNIVVSFELNEKTGYWRYLWKYQSDHLFNFHGMVEESFIKQLLSQKQWSDFRQGRREFIIQRKINGKNVSKGIKRNT